MRKPRDYDSELKALEDKAKELNNRKVQQLGELVIATGADAMFSPQQKPAASGPPPVSFRWNNRPSAGASAISKTRSAHRYSSASIAVLSRPSLEKNSCAKYVGVSSALTKPGPISGW